MQWQATVILGTWAAQAGRSFEPKSSRQAQIFLSFSIPTLFLIPSLHLSFLFALSLRCWGLNPRPPTERQLLCTELHPCFSGITGWGRKESKEREASSYFSIKVTKVHLYLHNEYNQQFQELSLSKTMQS